jgi:hypothetical protein
MPSGAHLGNLRKVVTVDKRLAAAGQNLPCVEVQPLGG